MSGVESDVLEEFSERMEDSVTVPATVAKQLRTLLVQAKLPKPEALVELFAAESGEQLA